MRAIIIGIICIHGLIHLMGFLKAFGLAELNQLTLPVGKTLGLLWLATAIVLLIAALLFLLHRENWWIVAAIAVVISQILIILAWKDAKFGTLLNMILIVPIMVSMINSLPGSYVNRFRKEVGNRLQLKSIPVPITAGDIALLPTVVQKYLQYTGSVNQPAIRNFRAEFNGQMKLREEAGWTEIHSVQYNFYDEPARLFYITSRMFGIPFYGYHCFTGSNATMEINVASLFQVADAKGEKMNQSETVTLFNDMCLLAPATLIDTSIQWEILDSLSVKARFTHSGITISAILNFNDKGELLNFTSSDRYLSMDGKTYESYPWSTPVSNYIEFNGRKIASHGEAVWHKPGGDYCYAKFDLKEAEFNLLKTK